MSVTVTTPDGGQGRTPFSKLSLVRTGQEYWPHMYKGASSDEEALDNWADYLKYLEEVDPEYALVEWAFWRDMPTRLTTQATARWVDQGMPVIKLSHKRAAALMATTISESVVDLIKPPFKAFFIDLPDGLLTLSDTDSGQRQSLRGVLVHQTHYPSLAGTLVLPTTLHHGHGYMPKEGEVILPGPRWSWLGFPHLGASVAECNVLTDELALERRLNEWAFVEGSLESPDEIGPEDSKVMSLVGRLICSLCLLMGTPGNFREKRGHTKTSGQRKTRKGDPEFRVFTETQSISIDVRPAIRDYLAGRRGSSPSIQFLVRGHWRNQAHGLQRSLRRAMWIEPFWKGPDGGLIASRSHVMKEDGPSSESENA